MTERDSSDNLDYPDGSVARYVRERWGAGSPAATRPYVPPPSPRRQPAPGVDPEHPTPADDRPPAPSARSAAPPAPSGTAPSGTAPSGTDGPGSGRPGASSPASARSDRAPSGPAASGPAPPAGPAPAGSGYGSAAPRPSGAAPAAAPGDGTAGSVLPFPGPTRTRSTAGPTGRPGTEHLSAVPPPPPTPPRGYGRWTDPGAVAAQEAQRARSSDVAPPELTSARLLRPTRRPPQTGWRRLLYLATGRLLNPGESRADARRRDLTARANRPLLGCYKIAMLSLKGGVGKTTTTATLGATFASLRGDRVVAVDANPDRGTLSQKIPSETTATVRHLLRDAQRVRRYSDVRSYTSQGQSRLEVLASEQDPAVSEAFSEDDYRRTVTLLEHFYNIVLTDCGTGLMHSAMYGVLGVADQLIVVSSGSIDGARSASATMDWLDAHGHGELVRSSVVVINCVHRSAGGVDLDRVGEHFAARCRAVVRIPFDPHLEEGAELDLERLEPRTRQALLELAASVADAFDDPGR